MTSTNKNTGDGKKLVKRKKSKQARLNFNAYQSKNFKTISAAFKRSEALYIADIFEAHGVKPAEILRGAAAALLDGQAIKTERKPLTVPADSD